MSRLSRAAPLAAYAVLCAPGLSLAGDWIKPKLDASTRKYCHLVHFPLGWQNQNERGEKQPPPNYNFDTGHYEFRVSGLPGAKFLVRGFVTDLDHRDYTANLYLVDLSDPAGVATPAREGEWNSASVLPLEYKYGDASDYFSYTRSLGFQFVETGNHPGRAVLSPDRAVLVGQSWKGTLGCCGGSDVPGDLSIHLGFGGSAHGELFFDAYSTSTGKTLVTVTAKFSVILPEGPFGKTGWVTGRYFFIPLDDRIMRCLVCEFGKLP